MHKFPKSSLGVKLIKYAGDFGPQDFEAGCLKQGMEQATELNE